VPAGDGPFRVHKSLDRIHIIYSNTVLILLNERKADCTRYHRVQHAYPTSVSRYIDKRSSSTAEVESPLLGAKPLLLLSTVEEGGVLISTSGGISGGNG